MTRRGSRAADFVAAALVGAGIIATFLIVVGVGLTLQDLFHGWCQP